MISFYIIECHSFSPEFQRGPKFRVFEKNIKFSFEFFFELFLTFQSVILIHQNFSLDQNLGVYIYTYIYIFFTSQCVILFHRSFFNVLECHSLFTRILGASVPKFRGCNNYALASLVSLPAERLMTVQCPLHKRISTF